MIRPSTRREIGTFVTMATATGMFKPAEIEALQEVYDDFFDGNSEFGHHCLTLLEDNKVSGFAYFGPDNIANGAWELWWIVVDPTLQGKGRGGLLLQAAEAMATEAAARLMFIDTSSLPMYDPTRRFYIKHGYEKEAELRDYYAPGDSKVIYRKTLNSTH